MTHIARSSRRRIAALAVATFATAAGFAPAEESTPPADLLADARPTIVSSARLFSARWFSTDERNAPSKLPSFATSHASARTTVAGAPRALAFPSAARRESDPSLRP